MGNEITSSVKLRHVVLLALMLLNGYVNHGFVENSYEALVLYITLTVPFGVALLIASRLSRKKDISWQRKLSFAGILVAAAALIMQGIITLYLLVNHYLL